MTSRAACCSVVLALALVTDAEPTSVVVLRQLRVSSVIVQTLVSADVPSRDGGSLYPRFQADVEARLAKAGLQVVREDRSTPTLFVGVVAARHPDFPKAVALRVWVTLLSPNGGPNPRSHVWDSDESGTGIVHLANEDEAVTVAMRAVIEKVDHFVSRVEPVGKAARPR